MTSPETSPLPGIDPGHEIVIVGAGPAGLTAAYKLSKAGVSSTVIGLPCVRCRPNTSGSMVAARLSTFEK